MQHENYLKQALQQAEIRRGFCAPNPAVGAVVVKNDEVLATGYHQASGSSHAEVVALNKIGDAARDATLYVTLEPCCHHGKTPPCTDLLIERGIKCVVYGMRDPNPQVANKSAQQLKNAGIECIYLALPEIKNFYQSYNYWWQTGKPFITAKLALSLDGKIAGKNGQRITITGDAAQLFTHQQRKRADAILTTAKTILHDDPQLNVRLPAEQYKKPLYVLDRTLATPLTAKIFTSSERLIFLHAANAPAKKITLLTAQGAHCQVIDCVNDALDLNSVVKLIGQDGIHDLWLEAGGNCFAAFVQAKLLQKAFIYVAPKWLGEHAQSAFTTDQNIFANVHNLQWHTLGNDAMCELDW